MVANLFLHEHIYRARHTFAITPNLVNTLSGSYVHLFTDESCMAT